MAPTGRQDTVIVDLDGTLANIDHRLKYVQTEHPDWDKFYAECVNDTPNAWCVDLIIAMSKQGYKVRIVSARSRQVERETHEWLAKIDWQGIALPIDMLRAGSKDNTKDELLKKAWLDAYGKERILFVVDDRTRVVEMWRAEGLVCLQAYEWAEYKRPHKNKDKATSMLPPEWVKRQQGDSR